MHAPSSGSRSFLNDFLKNSQLIQDGSLKEIRSAGPTINNGKPVLGIDGGFLVKRMLRELADKEPTYYLTQLLPHRCKEWLTDFVKSLEKNGVKPVFVFDGMPLDVADWTSARSGHRQVAVQWSTVAGLQGKYEVPKVRNPEDKTPAQPLPAADPLAGMTTVERNGLLAHVDLCDLANDEDAISFVVRHLLSLSVEVFRAPYWAWPQLIAFLAKGNRYVGDIYGASEILAFDFVDRLVLSVDTDAGKITYVEKEAFVSTIHSEEGFKDTDISTAILCDSQHRFFKFFTCAPQPMHSSLNKLLEILTKEGMGYIQTMPKLLMIQFAVKNPLVLSVKGQVELLQKVFDPKAPRPQGGFPLKDIYGTQLPACFYYFLFCNVISPQTLVAVVSSKIHDPTVLCDIKEVKIAVERVLPLRTQIVFQLVQQLGQPANPQHPQNYFNSDFSLTWMRNNMPVPILRPPQIKLDEWSGIRGDESATFVTVLNYAVNAVRDAEYKNVKEAIAAVHLKSLDLLGYFTHATHSNSTEVSGKSVYSEALSYCHSDPDYAVLLIELLRTRSLTDLPYQTIADSVNVTLAPGVRFFCRLCSLVPVKLKSPYTGPTHTGLLAFNTIVRHLHRTLRSLSEVVGLTLFLESRTNFEISQYSEFPNELPFKDPPGIVAGVVAFFIMTGPPDDDANAEWDAITLTARRYEYLATVFPDVADIKQLISDIFYFWEVGVNMLIQLHQDETPTVEAEVTNNAVEFHNVFVVNTALKYEIKLEPKSVPVPLSQQYYQ